MPDSKPPSRSPWAWIPTLYLAEGLPYALVMVVSAIMYKDLGISNTKIALYTSWLNLPWVVKPLWSPVVDILKTRRLWVWVMQLIVGAGLASVVLTIPGPTFLQWTLVFFFLLAFSSATHDIAADGFYMLALTEHQQSFFVGIRNTFYRIATITSQGLLVIFAGTVERRTGNTQFAWSVAFGVMAGLLLGFGAYHQFILPRPAQIRRENEMLQEQYEALMARKQIVDTVMQEVERIDRDEVVAPELPDESPEPAVGGMRRALPRRS